MKKKPKYGVRNWRDYSRSLRNRGSITFWISEELVEKWLVREESGDRGRPSVYTDEAIVAMAGLKFVFHQAGRQTSGLVASVFCLMKVSLPVPDHSTVSRRLSRCAVELPIKPSTKARHIVCDSTGVKVYGDGEWRVRTHGASKRRTWRKLHLHVDEATSEIIVAGASKNSVSDDQIFASMLDVNQEEIEQISADGAYDTWKVYDAVKHRKIERVAIPPRKNARIKQHGNSNQEPIIRDQNLRRIRRCGRKQWKLEAHYHRRSLAETAMFRFKQIFTDKLQSRKIENEFQEMFIKCSLLNRMTHLGMPQSYKVPG